MDNMIKQSINCSSKFRVVGDITNLMLATINNKEETKGKILILDDEEIIHLSLKRLFEDSDYLIDSAYTGQEALVKAKNNYDLIISDIRMQGLSGIDVLHELKKRQTNTEVIMLTGYASLDTATDAINSGAFGYFMKPIDDIVGFKAKVDEAINKSHIKQENDLIFNIIKSGKIEILNDSNILPINTSAFEENSTILNPFLQILQEGVLILNSNNNIIFSNIAFAENISISYKSILDKNILDFFSGDSLLKAQEFLSHIKSNQIVSGCELEINTNYNNSNFISVSGIPIIKSNTYEGAVLVINYTGEMKTLKSKLGLLSKLFEESIYDMMFVLNENGDISLCNTLARSTFGYSFIEMTRMNINHLLRAPHNEVWSNIIETLKKESSWRGECRAFSKQGVILPLDLTAQVVHNEANNHKFILCHMKILSKTN